MPCRSDYLEGTGGEGKFQRAAKLLIYVQERTGVTPEEWTRSEAENDYASDERSVTQLCAILKAMDATDRDAIVYNAHDRDARDLADWWEEHQAADAERERREASEKQNEELRLEALSKLSPEERKALGV